MSSHWHVTVENSRNQILRCGARFPSSGANRMEPSGPQVRDVYASFGNEGSDFEHLLDYGEFRYHLLLEFNNVEPECAENVALNRLYEAVSCEDQDAVQTAIDDCLGVLWEFLRSDYASRAGSIPTGVIKLQAITTNGILRAQS